MKHLSKPYISDYHSWCGKSAPTKDLLGRKDIDKVECEICLEMYRLNKKMRKESEILY